MQVAVAGIGAEWIQRWFNDEEVNGFGTLLFEVENMESKKFLSRIENTKRAHLILLRKHARQYLEMVWDELCEEQMASTTSLTDMEHNTTFHEAIWYASTKILTGLEIQVVIDDNWNVHISSGTAGFVGFPSEPKGLKLPIRCWIHTHPFGAAYFSSVDWRTISIWEVK